MFKIKHFQMERSDKAPNWTEAEKFLNKIEEDFGKDAVVGVTIYPTGPFHNMIVVYRDKTAAAAPKA